MAELDLVICGGQVVTERTIIHADLGIADGVIAQIGGDLVGRQAVDATGLLVLPGGVDALGTPAKASDGSKRLEMCRRRPEMPCQLHR